MMTATYFLLVFYAEIFKRMLQICFAYWCPFSHSLSSHLYVHFLEPNLQQGFNVVTDVKYNPICLMPSSISRNLISWILNLSNNFETHLFHLDDFVALWFFQQMKNFNTKITIGKKHGFQTFLEAILWCLPDTFQLSQKPQNHETYSYSKVSTIHSAVVTKSTSLQDVFQLSFHILCKAYIDIWASTAWRPPNHLNSWKNSREWQCNHWTDVSREERNWENSF